MTRIAARLALFCLYETGFITADQYTDQINAPARTQSPGADSQEATP